MDFMVYKRIDSKEFARRIRLYALKMVAKSHSSHIGSCLSIADILAVLYSEVLKINPEDPHWYQRDRFVLSKGHGAASLYAALAIRGFFPIEELDRFCSDNSILTGHINHHCPGVEVSTGSLGHGLSIACGMSLGLRGTESRVFVLLSDGECDEGSTWEAVLFAGHHRLENLIVIIDYNKLQSFGRVADVLNLEPFAEKWRAFGFFAVECDGHDHNELKKAFSTLSMGRPKVIIAHTIKGKGVSFMEDKLEWHYRSPNPTELKQAIAELGGDI